MSKYRKIPVVVEAMLYKNVDSLPELNQFAGESVKLGSSSFDGKKTTWAIVYIETLEGDMNVSNGDYIIKGVNGEFYPCKPDIFEKSYELVEGNE